MAVFCRVGLCGAQVQAGVRALQLAVVPDRSFCPWVVLLSFQTAQSRPPQGLRQPKSVRSYRGGSGSISRRVMATCYLQRILSAHSENTLKMQGLELSIDLGFRNGFFRKGVQLKNVFFWNFLAFIDGVTAPCKNAVNRDCGHLGGPFLIFKTFSWGLFGQPKSF